MGLSDGERMDGMLYCINELALLKGFVDYDMKPLNKMLNKVWPAMIGSAGNGTYWLFGGELSNSYFNELNFCKAAFKNVLHEFEDPNIEEDEYDKIFNKKNNDYWPSMESFLRDSQGYKNNNDKLYKVFQLCENFMYYANRYNDKLSAMVRKARELIANIKGFCFNFFKRDPEFFAAFMAEHIFDKIKSYNDDDFINKWFKESYLHHSITLRNVPRHILLKMFRTIRKKDVKICTDGKINIILMFMGNNFHYEHEHRKLFNRIEEHNNDKNNSNDLIDLEAIKLICAKAHTDHDYKEKNDRKNYTIYDQLFYEEV